MTGGQGLSPRLSLGLAEAASARVVGRALRSGPESRAPIFSL